MSKMLLFMGLVIIFCLSGCSLPGLAEDAPPPILSLFVDAEMANCENPLRENLCLRIKQKVDSPWELYPGRIAGMTYEPGNLYEIQVQAYKTDNGSSGPDVEYVLYKVLNTSPIPKTTDTAIDIREKEWILKEHGDPQHTGNALGEPLPVLNFGMDYHISGTTGCNTYTGIYSIAEKTIKFEALAASKQMCPAGDGLLEQEQIILKTLTQSDKFELAGDTFKIFSSVNNAVLVFSR